MSKNLVVDSSVIVKWLHQKDEQHLHNADKILEDATLGKIALLAPELTKFEVGNALLLSKKLPFTEAQTPLAALYASPVQFITLSEELALETYQIAQSAKITFYDASFAALAKQENAILVTDNPKHQAKIKEVQVIPLKDYR